MRPIAALGFVLLLATSAQQSPACSMGMPFYKVRSHFSAVVTDEQRQPLGGVEVTIMAFVRRPYEHLESREKVAVASTDGNGRVEFQLSPGEYSITTKYEHFGGSLGSLRVDPEDASSKGEIALFSPRPRIVWVQEVAGSFTTGKEHAPLTEAEISLKEFVSRQAVSKTSTDQDGHFAFATVKPGLYVMGVQASTVKGSILIDVEPDAKDAILPRFGLVMSSCGLVGIKDDGSMAVFELWRRAD